MIPHSTPEGTPHTVLITQLMLPGTALPAAELESNPTEHELGQFFRELGGEDFIQNALL